MIYVIIYLVAIVAANLTIAHYGPAASVATAFILIGLDFTLRDRLHDRWYNRGIAWKMGALIASGSVLSYLINAGTGRIALASCIAFGAAATIDALIYHRLIARRFIVRANGSNVIGAAVDSLLFPTIAFGALLPAVVLGQFAAKVTGGFIWSLLLGWRRTVLAAALLVMIAPAASAQTIAAHYDVARQAPIASFTYAQPVRILPKLFAAGFVETWYNPKHHAFPEDKWTVFSKHWLTYPVYGRLSVSTEIEVSRNMAGAWARWPAALPFKEDEWTVQPKIGLQIDLRRRNR